MHRHGYRILGCVNVSSGYAVFVFELFSKHADTTTEGYGPWGPNVLQPEPRVFNGEDLFGDRRYR